MSRQAQGRGEEGRRAREANESEDGGEEGKENDLLKLGGEPETKSIEESVVTMSLKRRQDSPVMNRRLNDSRCAQFKRMAWMPRSVIF